MKGGERSTYKYIIPQLKDVGVNVIRLEDHFSYSKRPCDMVGFTSKGVVVLVEGKLGNSVPSQEQLRPHQRNWLNKVASVGGIGLLVQYDLETHYVNYFTAPDWQLIESIHRSKTSLGPLRELLQVGQQH